MKAFFFYKNNRCFRFTIQASTLKYQQRHNAEFHAPVLIFLIVNIYVRTAVKTNEIEQIIGGCATMNDFRIRPIEDLSI